MTRPCMHGAWQALQLAEARKAQRHRPRPATQCGFGPCVKADRALQPLLSMQLRRMWRRAQHVQGWQQPTHPRTWAMAPWAAAPAQQQNMLPGRRPRAAGTRWASSRSCALTTIRCGCGLPIAYPACCSRARTLYESSACRPLSRMLGCRARCRRHWHCVTALMQLPQVCRPRVCHFKHLCACSMWRTARAQVCCLCKRHSACGARHAVCLCMGSRALTTCLPAITRVVTASARPWVPQSILARISANLYVTQSADQHAGMAQRQAVQAALRASLPRSAAQRCG